MRRVVGIAGLGLIGGSLAKAIKARTDCRVFGYDASPDVLARAEEQYAIDGELTDAGLAECDIVIAALYPDDVISYCESRLKFMRRGTLLVDCAGVKTRVCAALSRPAKQYGVRFAGGHPMAGVERSGFANAFAELFDGAVMILCEDENTDLSALDELGAFFLSFGFGRIKITTPREHDEIIAYTSQLAHLVSSAYIQSGTMEKRYGFSAGSFKDLTRVAKLNKDMWAELFFENRKNLLAETDIFLSRARQYRDALAASDMDMMKSLLERGTARKIADEDAERKWLAK